MPLLADAYVHRIDPVIIDFGHGIVIRWYGLAYLVGFAIGWLLLRWLVKSGRTLLTTVQLGDFLTALIIGVLVGGRVGHVLFYDRALLTKFTSQFPFWGLLEINHGGMASHGGIIGVILACVWFARRSRIPLLHLFDLAAFACPPGLGLGRVANFINGELPGKALPDSMQANPPWWSMKFPEEIFDPAFVHRREMLGMCPPSIPIEDFPASLVRAMKHAQPGLAEQAAALLTARYPSQFFQAFTDGVLLMAILAVVWLRPRKPGLVAGWFLMGYGALRFSTEQFREPDADVTMIGPLTLPMALSGGMVLAGVIMIVICARRAAPAIGGLRRLRAS
jgi:phosphatidylglycerol---prolipoprotein diacylglyceryl transferase